MKHTVLNSLPFVPTALFVICSAIGIFANRLLVRSRLTAAAMAAAAFLAALVLR